jgi:hypothetical protein
VETLTIGSQQSTRQKHARWLHEIITPRAMPIVKTSPSGSSSSSSDCHSSTLVVPMVVLLQPLPTLLSIYQLSDIPLFHLPQLLSITCYYYLTYLA